MLTKWPRRGNGVIRCCHSFFYYVLQHQTNVLEDLKVCKPIIKPVKSGNLGGYIISEFLLLRGSGNNLFKIVFVSRSVCGVVSTTFLEPYILQLKFFHFWSQEMLEYHSVMITIYSNCSSLIYLKKIRPPYVSNINATLYCNFTAPELIIWFIYRYI